MSRAPPVHIREGRRSGWMDVTNSRQRAPRPPVLRSLLCAHSKPSTCVLILFSEVRVSLKRRLGLSKGYSWRRVESKNAVLGAQDCVAPSGFLHTCSLQVESSPIPGARSPSNTSLSHTPFSSDVKCSQTTPIVSHLQFGIREGPPLTSVTLSALSHATCYEPSALPGSCAHPAQLWPIVTCPACPALKLGLGN